MSVLLVAQAEPMTGVLAKVGTHEIRLLDLEKSVGNSILSTRLPDQSRADVGALYAHWLRRLVAYQLLLQEAKALKMQDRDAFKRLLNEQAYTVYYQNFMRQVFEQIQLPKDALADFQAQGIVDDQLNQLTMAYRYQYFNEHRLMALYALSESYQLVFHEQPEKGWKPDDILAEADGFVIRYSDCLVSLDEKPDVVVLKRRLMDLAQRKLILLDAGYQEGAGQLSETMTNDVLVNLLIQDKQQGWAGTLDQVKTFFSKTSWLNHIPEQRLIAQLVVSTELEAENLRSSALEGASFFELASKYSVDAESRNNKGIVGWFFLGQGMAELEEGIEDLEDKQISGVIKTSLGYHLVMIVQRKAGQERSFSQVKAVTKQQLIQHKLNEYLNELSVKYPVSWPLFDLRGAVE